MLWLCCEARARLKNVSVRAGDCMSEALKRGRARKNCAFVWVSVLSMMYIFESSLRPLVASKT